MFDKENIIALWIVTILLIFVKGVFFWILWNWLIVNIFNLPELTFWQSIGGWYIYAILVLKINYNKTTSYR